MSNDIFTPDDAIAKRVLDYCRLHPKHVHWTWSGGVVAKGKYIPFFQIELIDIHRDFVNNFADEITIQVQLDTEDYYNRVVQDLENLTVYLTRKQMAENSTLYVAGGITEKVKYKAILHNPPVQGMAGDPMTGANKVNNPKQTIQRATFQLVLDTTLLLKTMKWSGLLENTLPSEALRMILSATSDTLPMEKGKNLVGIHMTPPDITEATTHIVIPQGTYVKDCAQLLQRVHGIYNFAIGSYLFWENWFVYPLFNTKRYDKEDFKLAITVIDRKYDLMSMPRTYYVDERIVNMFTMEATQIAKNAPADQLNYGTGIQVTNHVETAMKTTARDINKVKFKGNQVSTYNLMGRKDGYADAIPVYENTRNMANILSGVAGNKGTYVTISWQHANPDLLQPGMAVKIVYTDGSKRIVYGTLHEYHAISKRAMDVVHDAPFSCTVKMKIYIDIE